MKRVVSLEAGRLFGAPLLVAALAGGIYRFPSLTQSLEFDRAAIADGEWWRWLTGHLTHWSFEHLFWDLLAFAVLATLCEKQRRSAARFCLFVSAIAISGSLWVLRPELASYRGLSGVNAALFVFLAVTLSRREGDHQNLAKLSLLAFVTKLGYEALFGQSFFVSDVDGTVLVPLAHIVGSLTGAGLALVRASRSSVGSERHRDPELRYSPASQ